jgi:uncharacterized damage-inducible protein DinB
MPGNVPPLADERDQLLAYLAQQRYVLRLTAYGLTDDQARLTPTAGTLSVGGILRHLAEGERGWADTIAGTFVPRTPEEYGNTFAFGPDDTLESVLADYDETAAHTEAVVRGVGDLDAPVPVPRGVPWFPDDIDAWTVRWVLLHLIEETARHAGHADIVREAIDGATAFPLMAAAERWPATPWLQPWQPPSS